MESIKRIGVERTSVISMAGPIVTIVLSYLFLQETLNWIQWVGCLLVFLAIMVLQFKKTVYVT
ncbi:hypothetical protein JCM9140_1961 [Halalkalibacter wakoensis JCM 9140]|uniref:EamA domain-containing protein n=2 Tax=Halalkalibacter wakoensis TaxID=127891 RepID=W4Q2K7_9BACI|nr:hypothetical protein JCM9140_1961 [Halalkalibacter wakoensis JCM 9140]